ncbi:autotransporter outer membrane beta-barrel domain-containing protein [Rickettsia conorii]|uniref:autotransporter outer membrane beta-barrel domain-containing protein n=1 Tax=Rickettsia conorii TaxID=781 RepID=UPI002260B921|nr:autotransporter outer membrane beta-barrel domain-containing protein [Rickettsia conorii]UZW38930.1 autotransporter outer membrane beta-barrel domain-containing protein [Rickettsia conorii subsp. heilongjiangensis]
MEKYTTKNADVLDGNINQLAQAIKEGTNIEFIGLKREVASGIDQETRNLCVRMNQDAGLMQQLKANNSRLAAIIEAAAVNEAEVATRHPESAAAQAVANGDVSYGGVVVVAPAVASVAPVAPLVLLADPEEDAAEVIAVPAVAVPLATVPVVINMEDVGVVPPPVEEAPHTGAEIMIVQRIKRIVPVEGNIEGFDDKNDDFNIEEDYENDDYNIIQERTKVEVSSSTNKSESKDSEVSLENSKQEEARQEEEAKVVASIKEAAEASIAEVVEMQNAVKQAEEMIGAIYNL